MTKEEKRNLSWKLGEFPTASELADLVEIGVISKEEAREMMFGSAENDKEKIQALEEQVEFLRDLVETLSKNKTQTIIRDWTYDRPVRWYHTPYWRDTVTFMNNAGYKLSDNTAIGSTTGTVNGIATSTTATSGYMRVMDDKDNANNVTLSVNTTDIS